MRRQAPGSAAARAQVILANILLIGLILLCVFFTIKSPQFLTWPNIKILLVNDAPIGVLSVVFAMLVIAGYLDMSVGSIAALGALVCSLAVINWGMSPAVAIALGLLVGVGIGAINGYLCAVRGLNAFVVTLGMQSVIRGATLLIHQNQLFGLGGFFQSIAGGSFLGLPVLIWFLIVAFAVGGVFISLMPGGRHLYAIGANRQAAYLSGLSVRRLPFLIFVVTGAVAAFVGVLMASRLDGMTPGQHGLGLELQVLTIVLLGGVSFAGGRGRLFGVFVAFLFLSVLQDGLVIVNASPYVQMVASGAALVLAAGIDVLGITLTARLQARRRTEVQIEQAAGAAADGSVS
jgi:ribose/xylose/arabinose/galactoside ABC-type transport system permease subunit